MSKANDDLDGLLESWYPDVYRLCFLLSCHGVSAREITFQTFLYAASQECAFPDSEEAAVYVFSCAIKTCDDYFLRRFRRVKSRKQIQESVSFPISDRLWDFLKLPFSRKAALYLHGALGMSPETVARILHLTPAKTGRLLSRSFSLEPEELRVICPDPEDSAQISDELYLRFEERNVSLENRLRDLRLSLDRAIPWIAVGILVLFAAAAAYTAHL